jgi:hypothetical protein
VVHRARLTGTDPDNAAATDWWREEISASPWGWDLKLREDTVLGGNRTLED